MLLYTMCSLFGGLSSCVTLCGYICVERGMWGVFGWLGDSGWVFLIRPWQSQC